jgi:phosphatidylserine decarboxylase
MIVAREIRLILVVMAIIAIVSKVYMGWGPAVLVAGLVLLIAYLFRDPVCNIPSAPLAIVSPVSGQVISIENTRDEFLDRQAIRVRISMSYLDVHILRSPIEGKVKNQWAQTNLDNGIKKRYTYWIQTDEGDDIIYSIGMVKFSPFLGINLRCGERIGQGQKCGYLYFFGIVDVYVPESSRIMISSDDNIEAGSNILAMIIHKSGAQLTSTQVPAV